LDILDIEYLYIEYLFLSVLQMAHNLLLLLTYALDIKADIFSACIFVFCLQLPRASFQQVWVETIFQNPHGHYPSSYCQFTDVVFRPDSEIGSFFYHSKIAHHENCHGVKDVWSLQNDVSNAPPKCDETFDVGHVFTIYYWGGGSNYFHLHYDMMIPLYQRAYHNSKDSGVDQGSHVFMPSVESSRLKVGRPG